MGRGRGDGRKVKGISWPTRVNRGGRRRNGSWRRWKDWAGSEQLARSRTDRHDRGGRWCRDRRNTDFGTALRASPEFPRCGIRNLDTGSAVGAREENGHVKFEWAGRCLAGGQSAQLGSSAELLLSERSPVRRVWTSSLSAKRENGKTGLRRSFPPIGLGRLSEGLSLRWPVPCGFDESVRKSSLTLEHGRDCRQDAKYRESDP
jgi:hypothetical protein